MAQTSKYYKQQRYVSYNNGSTWTPLSEYRKGAWIEDNSVDCGGSPITYEKWEAVQGEYICDNTNKYTKERKYTSTDNINWTPTDQYRRGTLIESDSTACGYRERWAEMDINTYWICDEPPSEPIERWVDGYICDDCVVSKYYNTTTSETVISAECDSSSSIEASDITNRGNIKTSTIGSCITSIGNGTYSGCTSLMAVSIPSTVTSIGNDAFKGCVLLLDCGIPDSVKTIGSGAFSGCTQLAYINLPNGLTSLGTSAFTSCDNFSTINIPSTLTSIPDSCFRNCDGLSDIELQSTIQSIGSFAFADCSGLYNLTVLATTPPTLGTDAFIGVNSNFKIYVPSGSLNAYKTASIWSNYSDKIFQIQ